MRRVSPVLLAAVVCIAGCGSAHVQRKPPASHAPGPPNGCMPHPSACGFPDLTNTGVPPGSRLAPVNGVVTLDHPGEVYQDKQVTGAIVVTAPNVTIRNVRLVVTDPNYGISVTPGGDWNSAAAHLLVDHVEIDMNGNLGMRAIAFNGYTLRHSFVHDGADCAHLGADVSISDSLCVVGPDANGDGWPDGTRFCDSPEHFDGFQADGATRAVLRHNTVRNPCSQTSDIALFDAVRDVTVADNLLAGGGFSLYCGSPDARNVVVTGNRFARTWHAQSGRFGRMAHCDAGVRLSGNAWDGPAVTRDRATGPAPAS